MATMRTNLRPRFMILSGFAATAAAVFILLGRVEPAAQPAVVLGILALWVLIYWALRERALRGQELEPPGVWITRWGVVAGLAAVSLGISAFNTGVNLLYVLFASLLGVLLFNLPIAFYNIVGLKVRRRAPTAAFAGERIRVGLDFIGRRLPLSGMGLVAREIPDGDFGIETPIVRILRAPASAGDCIYYEALALRRGVFHWRSTRVASAFPFGFLSISRDIYNPGSIIVYPRLGVISRKPEPSGLAGDRRKQSLRPPAEPYADFRNLREYRHGDNPRLIHWRTSARQRKLFIREFERRTESEALIILETFDPAAANEPKPALEMAVSFAASIARDLSRADFGVGLAFHDGTTAFLAPESGPARYYSILEALAGLKISGAPTLGRVLEDSAVHSVLVAGSASVIVITPSARSDAVHVLGPYADSVTIVSIAEGDHERDYGFTLLGDSPQGALPVSPASTSAKVSAKPDFQSAASALPAPAATQDGQSPAVRQGG